MKTLLFLGLLLLSFNIYGQKRFTYDQSPGNTINSGYQRTQSGGWIRISSSPAASVSSNPTNLIIDFEAGVNGNVLGTNLIHSFTTGAQYGSTSGAFVVQSNGVTVTGTVSMVVSTTTAARGTRSMRVDTSVDNVQVLFDLGTSNLIMSYGMAIRLDSGWTGGTFSSYNFADLHSSDGNEFATINLFDGNSPNITWATQTGLGLSPNITISAATFVNNWYWMTVKWDGTGGSASSTIRIYNYVGSGTLGSEISGSPSTLGFSASPKYPHGFLFGRPDNHDVFNPGAFWYIDDIVLRWDGTFPVLPP